MICFPWLSPLLHHIPSLLSTTTSIRFLYKKKSSKFGQELTKVAPKLDMDNTTAASGSLPSLCYHSILLSPTATHTHSHASNAVPIPERTTFLRKKFSIPPMDNKVLILKILSPQAQRLWSWRRLPPRFCHHPSTQTFLMKTWCGATHWTAIPLQEETLTSSQSSLLPHQQNQPNRTFHLVIPSPLRLYTSQPYMIINQSQRKRHPLPIPIPTHKTPKTSTTSI